ncbi:hypothetical protein, partial [Hydrogenophilus thiooxidans]|uniref:hypothetical protein n=1 Tax=Hydrogenophilus thiooxidans TaxID=2820326 RepID=UPI001C21F303
AIPNCQRTNILATEAELYQTTRHSVNPPAPQRFSNTCYSTAQAPQRKGRRDYTGSLTHVNTENVSSQCAVAFAGSGAFPWVLYRL